ncbi:MAG: 4Fe-4S dicluster domain-containing protein [Deltaproteobacteria bacterium]|nr:4Fe-4S dicluster domain-containing protein [Deltaproteobacteria bacterium]
MSNQHEKKTRGAGIRTLDQITDAPLDRRSFIKIGTAAAAGAAALGWALSPLLDAEGSITIDEFLQRHYERLNADEMQAILRRIEDDISARYGVQANLSDPKPLPGVEYAYALNIGRCIGCRRCVEACMRENNTSRDPEIQYIRVLEMEKGSLDLEKSDHYYDPETVPQKDTYYMPVQCHQCSKAPCTKVCPVNATWQEPDGIIVVDYNWCIGCRYCMAACPYWARRFNYTTPLIPVGEITTDMTYLGNRIRPRGVVEKCTFCLGRVRRGLNPACVEACPTGSRVFGNVLDPGSPINYILREKRVYILKEDAGTIPRFYYFFDK